MKTMIMLLLTVFGSALKVNAQIFTNAQEDMARQRAAEVVAQMNDYVSFMARKDYSVNIRNRYRTQALNLYVGKGHSYELNGENRDGVIMEVSSVTKNTIKKQLIRNYFTNLINLRYKDVKITNTEVAEMKLSNLKKVDDNMYVCTCQFVMVFEGRTDRNFVYKDKTTKRIKCFVRVDEVVDEDGEKSLEFMVRLGDTQCISTERL